MWWGNPFAVVSFVDYTFYNRLGNPRRMASDVAQVYAGIAKSYDSKWGDFSESAWAALLPSLPGLAGKWILDAGCGTGLVTDRLANEVGNWGQVVAVDACQEMLDRAQCRLSDRRNVSFHKAPVTAIPARDRSFDIVISTMVMHELHDLGPVMREWRRVLNTQGEVVILDQDGSHWPVSLAHHVWRFTDKAYLRSYKAEEIESSLRNHGFSLIESRKVRISRFWRVWIVRARKE